MTGEAWPHTETGVLFSVLEEDQGFVIWGTGAFVTWRRRAGELKRRLVREASRNETDVVF
jgi:hypothetical protein